MAEKAVRKGAFNKDHPRYKWIALSNTTLGILMATINGSIVLISLPAIFTGIKINPLDPGNTSYLLWILMGYILVTAVLVVSFGRLGDIYGRVRIYNLGFVIFTLAAIALSFDPYTGGAGALWLIGWRIVQAVGGSMLFANSTAILTDAFPPNRRGFAIGLTRSPRSPEPSSASSSAASSPRSTGTWSSSSASRSAFSARSGRTSRCTRSVRAIPGAR
ncbi:MAG: MFS transporter [Galbitalea sp.]